jgi:hypothetical protein
MNAEKLVLWALIIAIVFATAIGFYGIFAS